MDKRQQALLFLLIATGAFSGCKDQKQKGWKQFFLPK